MNTSSRFAVLFAAVLALVCGLAFGGEAEALMSIDQLSQWLVDFTAANKVVTGKDVNGIGLIVEDTDGMIYKALTNSLRHCTDQSFYTPSAALRSDTQCLYGRGDDVYTLPSVQLGPISLLGTGKDVRVPKNSHCAYFKNEKWENVGCTDDTAFGFDLKKHIQIGDEDYSHLLFFPLEGTVMKGKYIYMKFESHGIRLLHDRVEHSISFIKSRGSPKNCLESRKERPSLLGMYQLAHDMNIYGRMSEDSTQQQTVEAYFTQNQRNGCEVLIPAGNANAIFGGAVASMPSVDEDGELVERPEFADFRRRQQRTGLASLTESVKDALWGAISWGQ